MQKSQKKKRKFFYGTFSLAVFLFRVIKRAEKVSGFGFFFVRREGKCEINLKKKENFFFSYRKLFHHLWKLVCQKR